MYCVVEGPEATGKTTIIDLLKKKLPELLPDREIVFTKEPGSTHDEVCQAVRTMILNPKFDICDQTALLLFLADRSQHMNRVVLPALDRGALVVSDRSSISTVVYHIAKMITGLDCDMDHNFFYEFLDFAQVRAPDYCFITGADFDWTMERLEERGGKDRIEQFGEEFHRNIHELFNDIAINTLPSKHKLLARIRISMETFPKNIVRLPNANFHTPEELAESILKRIVPNEDK